MRDDLLGRPGLFVSELCLGTMTFGHAGRRYAAASGVGQDNVDAIVRAAVHVTLSDDELRRLGEACAPAPE